MATLLLSEVREVGFYPIGGRLYLVVFTPRSDAVATRGSKGKILRVLVPVCKISQPPRVKPAGHLPDQIATTIQPNYEES